jgi:tRNA U34 5-carboxymethylaminomethyl modifying GTPase MnmE/TrmE
VAHVEAYIDFSEDQHLEDNVLEEAKKKLKNLRNEIKVWYCT